MDCSLRPIRKAALQKIATLSANSCTASRHDLDRLCKACPAHHSSSNGFLNGVFKGFSATAQVPMSVRELEVLLALCRAAPVVESPECAERLLLQLSPYLLEAHTQAVISSPSLRSIEPSPWEASTYNLTCAILILGKRHASLKEIALDKAANYLDNCIQAASHIRSGQRQGDSNDSNGTEEEALNIATLLVSILGFLEAAATYADFWSTVERLQIIQRIRTIFTESFLVSVETAVSTIRNSQSSTSSRPLRDWKRYAKHYAASGRPLGAMLLQHGLMRLLVSSTSLLIADASDLRHESSLDVLLSGGTNVRDDVLGGSDMGTQNIEALVDILIEEMTLLEDGADFLRLGSTWQQRLGFSVKAYVLTSFLNCAFFDENIADADVLMSWLKDAIADPLQMADDTLAPVVLKCMANIAKISPDFATDLRRSLHQFIVQGGVTSRTICVAATSLAYIAQMLSPDAIINTLYTLGNVLSSAGANEKATPGASANGSVKQTNNLSPYGRQTTGSAISLTLNGDEESSAVYANIVRTIVGVASNCNDDKITSLAQSMLLQKIGKINTAVDLLLVTETAKLAIHGGELDFKSLLKLYVKLSHDSFIKKNDLALHAILKARNYLSVTIDHESPLFEVYLSHLLETIISKGDIHESRFSEHVSHRSDVELAACEIVQLLEPLALLMTAHNLKEVLSLSDELLSLFRDAWFNIVVHDITPFTPLGSRYIPDLRRIAIQSRPLIAEQRADQLESDMELNTVLRRGMNPQRTTEQKRKLIGLLPLRESDIKGLNYPKVIFLSAAYLLETMRAESGDCSKVLAYFLDPSLKTGEMGNCMVAISEEVMNIYMRNATKGGHWNLHKSQVALQLVEIFKGCCHRIERVQQVAATCADRIVKEIPSALCEKSSLFALLELLSIMWISCLEAETDEYDWKSSYFSALGKVSVELSDSYTVRQSTLNFLSRRAYVWVMRVINIAPLDIKGLLQTYLSEHDDGGAYGHVSRGRSFAAKMGSVIPDTDQRLRAIDRHGDADINTASDFIAQYTARQEYRYAEALPDHDLEWLDFTRLDGNHNITISKAGQDIEDAESILIKLEGRTLSQKYVSIAELRDVLRRAAALLCRSKKDQCAIVHHLVGIPFSIFTKQAIKLGISLWMGVINENPFMQSRILVEIAENWERTVHSKKGAFNEEFHHSDPFYLKEEFAPSDKGALLKRQQKVLNLIGPHFRILQFLTSHFGANRFGSPHLERIFHRLIVITLDALKNSAGHPLAREIHFQIVLLGLKILRHSTKTDPATLWNLKDRILSAALRWFAFPPRWSFGGNRLQIKAETHLLADVEIALRSIANIGAKSEGLLKSLQSKQDLLLILLQDEQTRLMVWLFPLDHDKKQYFSTQVARTPTDALISTLLKTAWAESVALTVQLATRFQSAKTFSDIRWLLVNFPKKALGEPEALQILLGGVLPTDLTFQLKYLLYWAPVDPITAVTYFLPTYGSNPFILQYAMRALESHSVDVTFFYVPQIVQSLRHDNLGYVERYIIETAKFSQLFAHQIIWNMKANAYKDEDSEVPDSVKPILDKVMASLISSFSLADKAFYEREFSFFNEITDISGKLRPYIKKTKPEKKQKIEEELRKIKVDVGVYLPSNPDGVVIGIDRKSGKPLQSHAKAPYMATFRIQKNVGSQEGTEKLLEEANRDQPIRHKATIEVWQSAIFKVGDDCRQDVLALQLIATFRGIFNSVGLDVFVYPYRVTATAPGCGVIDVLPNSISRDMLGREAVNGLYDYFISKYGGIDSIRFQEARSNFVKSMAAYSVISYLLQFKDRHNGNIMIDDAGHILHIDFGFCFDIAPGGVKFERAPFKLTGEMIAVMGGSTDSQSFYLFEQLCIKSFLASRQYCEKLVHVVQPMLDSGLPCFKPTTIQNFRDRFVLDKNEREAAEYMRYLVKRSAGSYSTGVYDEFQKQTNGIPY